MRSHLAALVAACFAAAITTPDVGLMVHRHAGGDIFHVHADLDEPPHSHHHDDADPVRDLDHSRSSAIITARRGRLSTRPGPRVRLAGRGTRHCDRAFHRALALPPARSFRQPLWCGCPRRCPSSLSAASARALPRPPRSARAEHIREASHLERRPGRVHGPPCFARRGCSMRSKRSSAFRCGAELRRGGRQNAPSQAHPPGLAHAGAAPAREAEESLESRINIAAMLAR